MTAVQLAILRISLLTQPQLRCFKKQKTIMYRQLGTGEDDISFIKENVPENCLLGILTYSPKVSSSDRAEQSVYDNCKNTVEEVRDIKSKLSQVYN